MDQGKEQQSLGELFGELSQETSQLVRQEIALARAEVTNTARQAGKDVGMIAAGGVIAYAGFLVLLGGIAIALGALIPLWLATLIVGAIVIAVGGALIAKGRSDLQQLDLTPVRTMDTLREDKEWAKEQTT